MPASWSVSARYTPASPLPSDDVIQEITITLEAGSDPVDCDQLADEFTGEVIWQNTLGYTPELEGFRERLRAAAKAVRGGAALLAGDSFSFTLTTLTPPAAGADAKTHRLATMVRPKGRAAQPVPVDVQVPNPSINAYDGHFRFPALDPGWSFHQGAGGSYEMTGDGARVTAGNEASYIQRRILDRDCVIEWEASDAPADPGDTFGLMLLQGDENDDNYCLFNVNNRSGTMKATVGHAVAGSYTGIYERTVSWGLWRRFRLIRTGQTYSFDIWSDDAAAWGSIWSGTLSTQPTRAALYVFGTFATSFRRFNVTGFGTGPLREVMLANDIGLSQVELTDAQHGNVSDNLAANSIVLSQQTLSNERVVAPQPSEDPAILIFGELTREGEGGHQVTSSLTGPVTWTKTGGTAASQFNVTSSGYLAPAQTGVSAGTVELQASNGSQTETVTKTIRALPRRYSAANAAELTSLVSVIGENQRVHLRPYSVSASALPDLGAVLNLDGTYQVGQYVNGDWWVNANGGTVGVVSITPESVQGHDGTFDDGTTYTNRTLHGAQINPGNRSFVGGNIADNDYGVGHGYDGPDAGGRLGNTSTLLSYYPDQNVDPGKTGAPISLSEGTICKAISVLNLPATGRAALRDLIAFTVVAQAPAPRAFRPPIATTDKTSLWSEDALDYTILPKLTPVASAPGIAQAARNVERLWQVQQTNNTACRNISPQNNHSEYGRDRGQQLNQTVLSLCFDYPDEEKREALIGTIQIGIDVYGRRLEGGYWYDLGGGNMNFKVPLVIAGLALNDATLKTMAGATNFWNNDRQTFVVSQSDVDLARYTADGRARSPYEPHMIGTAEWGEQATKQPQRSGSNWQASYRDVCSTTMFGSMLAMRLIEGAQTVWNNQRVFDYCDIVYDVEKHYLGDPNSFQTFDLDCYLAYRDLESDNIAPTLDTAFSKTDGNLVYLRWSKTLTRDYVPAGSSFALIQNGSPVPISAVSQWGRGVKLTLGSAIPSGASVQLSYTQGSNALRDLAGNLAPAFAGAAVTNNA